MFGLYILYRPFIERFFLEVSHTHPRFLRLRDFLGCSWGLLETRAFFYAYFSCSKGVLA